MKKMTYRAKGPEQGFWLWEAQGEQDIITRAAETQEDARCILQSNPDVIDDTGFDLRGCGLPVWQTHEKIGAFLRWAKKDTRHFIAAYHVPCQWGEFFIAETAKGELWVLQDDPELPDYQTHGSFAGMDLPGLIEAVLRGV